MRRSWLRGMFVSPLPPLGVIGVPGLVKCSLVMLIHTGLALLCALSKDIRLQVGVLLPLRCLETSQKCILNSALMPSE